MEVEYEGKNYRCERRPDSEFDCGQWSFYYKEGWHDVKNRFLRFKLNKLLKPVEQKSPAIETKGQLTLSF